MIKVSIYLRPIIMGSAMLLASALTAQTLPQNVPTGLPPAPDNNEAVNVKESLNVPTSPIAFGIEAGANMDFSGTESSNFDIDIFGGYRKGVIQLAGLGIGIHPSFAHQRTFIPIYALFRCNFKEGRSLCFADVKAGLSINELDNKTHYTGAYASAGIGFNLLQTRRLKTYILAGYNFTQIVPFANKDIRALHGVSVRIGITF